MAGDGVSKSKPSGSTSEVYAALGKRKITIR